jgi:hypothetical protein
MGSGVVKGQRADFGRQFQPAGADDRQVIVAQRRIDVIDEHMNPLNDEPTGGSFGPMGGDTRAA